MQPLAAATSAQFYGTIAVARQVTAPPQLYTRRMAVGRHRHTPIAVTVKGSRALVKVYTDVHLRVEQASACYGMGLEPVIAMVTYSLFCRSCVSTCANVAQMLGSRCGHCQASAFGRQQADAYATITLNNKLMPAMLWVCWQPGMLSKHLSGHGQEAALCVENA